MRDIYPTETEVLRLKITGWVEHQINAMVAEFTAYARSELARLGFTLPAPE